jgi:hypothetical protein
VPSPTPEMASGVASGTIHLGAAVTVEAGSAPACIVVPRPLSKPCDSLSVLSHLAGCIVVAWSWGCLLAMYDVPYVGQDMRCVAPAPLHATHARQVVRCVAPVPTSSWPKGGAEMHCALASTHRGTLAWVHLSVSRASTLYDNVRVPGERAVAP